MKQFALILVLAASLIGCDRPKADKTLNWSAEQLFAEAKKELNEKNYISAVALFEKLQSRYPYDRYAPQAEIETAYTYYKQGEKDSAIAACDRFIKMRPAHPNVDYAYYLKGLSDFNPEESFLSRISDQDPSERDPAAARASFEAFKRLVTLFPNSKYAPDAADRMRYLVYRLAAHEIHAAEYYMQRHAYLAAIARAEYTVEHYPRTPAVRRGLQIMETAYDRLGLVELRDDTRRIMTQSYPDQHPAVSHFGRKEKRWWQIW